MDLEVEVKYLDSKDNRDIQMADYVANLIWKKFNRQNEDLSRRVPQHYRTYISKFPFKLFGHNPSIKELEVQKWKIRMFEYWLEYWVVKFKKNDIILSEDL